MVSRALGSRVHPTRGGLGAVASRRRFSSALNEDSPIVKMLRRDLAAAHQLTYKYKMDDLVWNHISARVPEEDGGGFLVTPVLY